MTTTNSHGAKSPARAKSAKTAAAPRKPRATKTAAHAPATPVVPDEPILESDGEPRTDAKSGPVLGAYRLGLKGLDVVTASVGGLALGSMSRLGLPDRATRAMTSTHAKVVHGTTHVSDRIGTAAAKTVGKGVSAASNAAKFLFP